MNLQNLKDEAIKLWFQMRPKIRHKIAEPFILDCIDKAYEAGLKTGNDNGEFRLGLLREEHARIVEEMMEDHEQCKPIVDRILSINNNKNCSTCKKPFKQKEDEDICPECMKDFCEL